MNKALKVSKVSLIGGAAGAVGWAASGSPLVAAVSAAMAGLVMVSGQSKPPANFGIVARGTEVSTKKRRRGFSPTDQIAIGGIPIAPEFEPQHFLGVGAPGTGKTVVIEGGANTKHS